MPPIVQSVKHFKTDPVFFSFSFLGFSDLDLLDFFFGSFEAATGKDVRKEWIQCYMNESIMSIISALLGVGFSLLSA